MNATFSQRVRQGRKSPRLPCLPVSLPRNECTGEWNRATVVLATPQVIKNDLIAVRYSLQDVTLLIVDECHRATGNYALYPAQRYLATADKPLLLAMTASPGGIQEKVQEVCMNLGISRIESRTENDPDVRPYVFSGTLNSSVLTSHLISNERSPSSIPSSMSVSRSSPHSISRCQSVKN